MTSISVWTGGSARAAAPLLGSASAELLGYFGFEVEAASDEPRSPVGDALASLTETLGIKPERDLLTSADVVGRSDPRLRVGDVLPAGDVEALALGARGGRRALVVVADADDPVRSMAEQLRKRVEDGSSVMGVMSLGEAAERLFGLRALALKGDLVPTERRAPARAVLFERSLTRSRLGWDWSFIAAVAIGLARHLDSQDSRARFELDLVRDIARRHTGITALILWPDDEDLTPYAPEQRLQILSHVVQSAADGDGTAAAEAAGRARQVIGSARSQEALKLLGAVGRALAAVGDYDGAAEALGQALDGWLVTAPSEASYALCEALRIAGIRGRSDEVKRLQYIADEQVRPSLGADSTPYVVLALGRALAQVGRAREALDVLDAGGVDGRAPRHVQTAGHRWRASAAWQLRDLIRVGESRERLERLGESDQRLLARLDSEELDVAGTKRVLDGLLAMPDEGDEARRLLTRLAPGLSTLAIAEHPEVVRRFRAEYRY